MQWFRSWDLLSITVRGHTLLFISSSTAHSLKNWLNAILKMSYSYCFSDEKLDLNDSKWEDIHVVTGALKMFFRELPEPLFTFSHFNDFVNAISKYICCSTQFLPTPDTENHFYKLRCWMVFFQWVEKTPENFRCDH